MQCVKDRFPFFCGCKGTTKKTIRQTFDGLFLFLTLKNAKKVKKSSFYFD
jgi:hypothetical protein